MAAAAPLVSTEVDGYRVEGVLGRGASGVVYRVHDPELDRPLALKLLTDDRDEESRARFRLEARAAARVIHPNVVQVYGAGEHEGQPYILQELVEGLPVSRVLEARGRLDPAVVIEIGVQAAAGLAEAARVGVLHRDVKPHNLLLTETGEVKLADFGLAKLLFAPSGLTERGTTLGTPHYMSPEQGRGLELDARSDQYALGATLYHLLTGTPPFEAEGALEILLKHAQEELTPLRAHGVEAPAGLIAAVERMLAKRPEGRFEDFEAVVDALEALQDEAEDGAAAVRQLRLDTPEEEVEPGPCHPRMDWRERALFAVAGGVALAVAGAVLFVSPGPPKLTGRATALAAPAEAQPSFPAALERDPFEPREAAPAKPPSPRAATRSLKQRSSLRLVRDLRLRPAVAVAAAQELARREDQTVTFGLLDALARAKNPDVATAIGEALGAAGDIRALERLDRLGREGRTSAVRAAAQAAHAQLYRVEE